jgi:hypothetical protein
MHVATNDNSTAIDVAVKNKNADTVWVLAHAQIVDVAIAFASLNLPAYVLLWIVDFLPHIKDSQKEITKVKLLVSLIKSIRRAQYFTQRGLRRRIKK